MYDLLTGAPGFRIRFTVVYAKTPNDAGLEDACVLLFDRLSTEPHDGAGPGLHTAVVAEEAAVRAYLTGDECEGAGTRYAWPLIDRGHLLGALQVCRTNPAKPDQPWRAAMETLADRLAASIGAAPRCGAAVDARLPSRN
jgi:hypothetical protein